MVSGVGGSPAPPSPVEQTALQMGFDAAVVQSLVRTRLLLTGRHYGSVPELVSDVLQAEREERRTESQGGGEV